MCQPMIGILPEEYRKDHWPIIEKLLEKAIEHSQGEFDARDIELGLEEKDYVLFGEIFEDRLVSVVFCNMLFYPKKKVLNIAIAAGERMNESIERYLEMIEAYAKDLGCSSVRVGGREGWVKMLRPFGYTEPYRFLEKVV